MRIAVAGGTGTIGRAVVRELEARGHDVAALSRSGPVRVDLRDGSGLPEALAGCDVVVDAANGPPNKHAAGTLVEGTRRLLEAEGGAHHVLVSIVGCDRTPTAYYRVKMNQEALVEGAGDWSIVRATQLHDLLDLAFASVARYGVVPAPRGRLQPVDVGTVARAIADVAVGPPLRGRLNVGGPEVDDIRAFARAWRRQRRRRAPVVPLPLTPGVSRALRAGGLTDPAADRRGDVTFAEWLAR